jgi:rSAM/selenodomain-associated transferase 2
VGYLAATLPMAFLGPLGRYLFPFGGFYLISFVFLVGLLWSFPADWPARRQLVFIFSLAVVIRLAFFSFPASHDVNRYIWEGHVLNNGFNPYIHSPSDPILKPLINEIWHGINHKDASACYPPLAMILFRLAAFISPTPLFFKVLMTFFDLATIWVLACLLRSHGLPPSRLVLYALNPLVLLFVAGQGHLDAMQAFFICLCFLLFAHKREGWGFFSLGCAVMSKYFAIILVPFLINAKNWRKGIFLLGALVAFYLPFRGTGTSFFTSLVPFGTVMHYNDSITVFLRAVLGTNAAWGSAILLGVFLSIIFLTVHDPLRSSYLAIGSLLVLLGTLHPWYLVMITPFLLFFPSWAWLYLHLAVLFTFPVMHVEYHTGVFQEIHWLKLLEYAPFYGLLVWGTLRKAQIIPARAFKRAGNISVVIPTLNESEHIGHCLEALRRETAITKAMVVDGGSTDGTREIARRMGYPVVTGERGRGSQIRTGINCSGGDVILILHADCVIGEGTPALILRELNEKPWYIGGAVGMEYFSSSMKTRFISWLNNVRAMWTGISFGDQAQFFRREALHRIGGFPDLMLMEDVELSQRLKEKGPLCFIPRGVAVSSRRWDQLGFWSTGKGVIWRCLGYLIQRRLGRGEERRGDASSMSATIPVITRANGRRFPRHRPHLGFLNP